jgi:hypothetical protein
MVARCRGGADERFSTSTGKERATMAKKAKRNQSVGAETWVVGIDIGTLFPWVEITRDGAQVHSVKLCSVPLWSASFWAKLLRSSGVGVQHPNTGTPEDWRSGLR